MAFDKPRFGGRGIDGGGNSDPLPWGVPSGSIGGRPGMIGAGGDQFGRPQYQNSPIGNMVGNELYDPETGGFRRTGAQRGTDAGQALRALAEASGMNLLGSSSSSGSGGAGGVGSLPAISMPDTSAANAAAFGRAKDRAGQTTRASLTALRDEMAGRGLRGSGIEAGEVGKTVARGAAGVNEFTREQAIQDAGNAADLAKQEYQGRIVQRGQDIGVAQANASRQQQQLDGLLSLIGGRGILY